MTGGVNAFVSCSVGELGECDITGIYDYCKDGAGYRCPSGMTKKASGPYVNTINDCEDCLAG